MLRWPALGGFIAGLALATPADAQDSLSATVSHIMQLAEVPGLQVAVVEDGSLAWGLGVGVLSNGSDAPVTRTTVFEAASLSKPVFAYAVLQLIDAGVVDLDRPLAEYFKYEDLGHDSRTEAVTARMVLSHSAGLPNWRPRDSRLEFASDPGTRFQYSGEGFVYLQRVVEYVTGETLEQLAVRLVFQPLAMNHSSYQWHDDSGANVAVGHRADGHPLPKQTVGDDANAAWSLHTTADDYATFLASVMRGVRLSDSLHRALMTPQVEVADGVFWGLGWGIEEGGRATGLWHWGHNDGYRAFVLGYPGQGDGMVMFSNSDNGMLLLADLLGSLFDAGHPSLAWLDYESWDDPARLVRSELEQVIRTDGIEAGIERYRALRRSEPSEAFEEGMLNVLGYNLLRSELVREAIVIFQLNVANFPAAANTYDSLGEAYFVAGDYPRALANYRTSVRLNPDNVNGWSMIDRVKQVQRAERAPGS